MNVKDRIKQASVCEVIDLNEKEKDVYRGAGRKLARFVNGQLVELFDPLYHSPGELDDEAAANVALRAALDWATHAKDEVWSVMCSCYQLCEPRPFIVTDAAAVARLARQIGDDIADCC